MILQFTYPDGAKDVVGALKSRGYVVGLITGALSPVADKVARDLGMDFVYSNATMLFGKDDVLEGIQLHGEDFAAKVDATNDLRHKYPDATIYYVADGDNDKKVTKGILVTADHHLHESWKSKALEDGQGFSAQRAAKIAWKVAGNIKDVQTSSSSNS